MLHKYILERDWLARAADEQCNQSVAQYYGRGLESVSTQFADKTV